MSVSFPSDPDSQAKPLGDVQVVINSYGREAWYVERAAASMLSQRHPPLHIHFIDQNPEPLALSPVLLAEPSFHHHHRPGAVCSLARNVALQLVPSGWIAFADDDAHWTANYSERLRQILTEHPGLDLIAGSMIDESTGKLYTLRHELGGDLGTFVGTKLLYGANFLIRAEVFRRVGGYDPRLGPGTDWPSSEEADLCWRVVTSGAPCLFDRELAIRHPSMHLNDARAAARKGYRYGLGKGALAALWLFEKRHRYGLFEFFEMSLVPVVNMLRGVLRGEFSQLRIQGAILLGRQRGFWTVAFRPPAPPR